MRKYLYIFTIIDNLCINYKFNENDYFYSMFDTTYMKT